MDSPDTFEYLWTLVAQYVVLIDGEFIGVLLDEGGVAEVFVGRKDKLQRKTLEETKYTASINYTYSNKLINLHK